MGGKTRQESTYNALRYIKKKGINCSNVLVHDSARPNFSIGLIKKIIKISTKNTVIPILPISDALKKYIGYKNILNLKEKASFQLKHLNRLILRKYLIFIIAIDQFIKMMISHWYRR